MKLNQMMCIKIFTKRKVYLILVIDPVKKKLIGKMKNEVKGEIISEFVGLRSKMYSLIDVDGEENEKVEVNQNNVKNIRDEEYLEVLLNKKLMRQNGRNSK